MSSRIKYNYLDDDKLAQLALTEVRRANASMRLIAFTGSMATQSFGYGSWDDIKKRFFEQAKGMINACGSWAADAIDRITAYDEEVFNSVVTMSLVEEVLDHRAVCDIQIPPPSTEWPLDLANTPMERLAQRFSETFRHRREAAPPTDASRILFERLGIRRFATLNYDFELERIAMLRDKKEAELGDSPSNAAARSPFIALERLRSDSLKRNAAKSFSWDLGSGRIRRVLMHGRAVESDLLNRERIDRLIEFSVGADDVDAHVMHMHGRACNWRTMIVTQRDYDDLYRRNDLNRLPFEFARRLMMGGNPILFVGLGMKEDDVNRELREFISNKPYQRIAPVFLLWSAVPGGLPRRKRAAMRLDWLHRLGVLTIFDTDLDPDLEEKVEQAAQVYQRDKKADPNLKFDHITRGLPADPLEGGVSALADSLEIVAREDCVGGWWRTSHSKFATFAAPGGPGKPQLFRLWNAGDVAPIGERHTRITDIVADRLFVIGPSGCGKGRIADAVAKQIVESGQSCLLINAGFCFDTDSMLDGIARFLDRQLSPLCLDRYCDDAGRALMSRSDYFRRLSMHKTNLEKGSVSIVINGSERCFSLSGEPLSAELDELMRLDINVIHWVVFGTDRVVKYATEVLGAKAYGGASTNPKTVLARFWDLVEVDRDDRAWADERIPYRQLDVVVNAIGKRLGGPQELEKLAAADWRSLRRAVHQLSSRRASQMSGDARQLVDAFYALVLDQRVMERLFPESAELAYRILRALAFFGPPVEARVLADLPKIDGSLEDIQRVLKTLDELHLVVKLNGFTDYAAGSVRYALHRSLMTVLRSRFGIPLTEAKLSTAFNMSLYVAQPVDGYIPEPEIHDELSGMVDALLGAYQKPQGDATLILNGLAARGITRASLQEARLACQDCRKSNEENDDAALLRIHMLCSAEGIQQLRAAFAVLRGYYSTTGILALDIGDRLVSDERDGILLEHAERLDRLIDLYGKMTLARESLRNGLPGAISEEGRRSVFDDVYTSAEPFYPDELVWLHNERGVVCLTMGDLYEARASFERAMGINRRYVEFDDRTHNWRRIRLNQLHVEIEMGDIGLTRGMAREVIEVSRGSTREDQLASAVALGIMGWCHHLQGAYDKARRRYKAADRGLAKLNETRAQAYFQRLAVNTIRTSDRPDEKRGAIRDALYLAQSTRQMDIVYRLQITLADAMHFSLGATQDDLLKSNRRLEEALQYSLLTDVHRVRCEASMVIGRIRHSMGDYEGSLRYATDALMIATRYGMELRKIVLRIDIAKTMAARGHPVTAENLALAAVNAASRQRYETAMDKAARVMLEIPNVSSVTGKSDLSGLRNY